MTKTFRGSYTATITPFTEDGSAIDILCWKIFLDWQLEVVGPPMCQYQALALGLEDPYAVLPPYHGFYLERRAAVIEA